MALEASVAAAFTYLMQHMLDGVFTERDPVVIRWLPWVILLLFALRALGVYIGDLGAAKIARSIVRDVRARCFEHYLRLPSSYYAANAGGPLLSRLTVEIEQLGHACTEGFKIIVADGLMIIGLLAVMVYHSPKLTATVLIAGPLIGGIVSLVSKRYRRLSRTIQNSMGELTQRAHQALQGERDVKLFAAHELEAQAFQSINEHNYRQQLKVTATSALSTSIIQFLAAGALALVIFVASREAQQPGTAALTPGQFMSFITAMLLILPSLKRLTNVQNLIGRGVNAAASVEEVLATPIETDLGTQSLPEAIRGEVRFERVQLRYENAPIDALNDINLTLKPGTVTALVGPSGSGKTSLAQLLPRLVQATSGQIFVDDIAITDLRLKQLRAAISWVGQNVVLNGETVFDNICYGDARAQNSSTRKLLEPAVEKALHDAQAYEFVAQLPQGWHTPIGANGAQLSGGQRQRLALARAFFKGGRILVLDEATSALDTVSERLIQQALDARRHEMTALVIAHRLSTIENADQIAVMDRGRILEIGTHAQLLAGSGLYAGLYRAMQAHEPG